MENRFVSSQSSFSVAPPERRQHSRNKSAAQGLCSDVSLATHNSPAAQPHPLHVWVSCGPGSEPIDAVRRITNHSTGALGAALAEALATRGHRVTAWIGNGAVQRPHHPQVRCHDFQTGEDLASAWSCTPPDEVPDIIFHAAALGDYRVCALTDEDGVAMDSSRKLESRGGRLHLTLEPSPKLILNLHRQFPHTRIVGWKYETHGGRDRLITLGHHQMESARSAACVLNGPAWGEGFGFLLPNGTCLEVADRPALLDLLCRWAVADKGNLPVAIHKTKKEPTMNDQPCPHIRHSMTEALLQGLCLLEALNDEHYTAQVPEAFDASIGGHYRHCIEHFEPLLEADAGIIDYDARPRDRRLETDRRHAIARTKALVGRCESMDAGALALPVQTRCKTSYAGDASPLVTSTLGREGMYAVVHAIHHYALIGVMCRLLDIPLPDGFGIAPSTAQLQKVAAAHA